MAARGCDLQSPLGVVLAFHLRCLVNPPHAIKTKVYISQCPEDAETEQSASPAAYKNSTDRICGLTGRAGLLHRTQWPGSPLSSTDPQSSNGTMRSARS